MQSIIDGVKTHFFQYMEVQILHQYILKGIQYFLNVIFGSKASLISFRYYTHEITMLIDLIINTYYLYRFKASYSENFYQLQRQVITQLPFNVIKNAIIWVIMPYVYRKLDEYYNNILQQPLNQSSLKIKLFQSLYPYFHCLLGMCNTLLKLLYLLRKEHRIYNIQYYLSNQELVYQQRQQSQQYPILQMLKSPILFFLLGTHKILTWYYQKKNNDKSQSSKIKIIEPPFENYLIENNGKCPLCAHHIKQPAFVRESAHTYCYECIANYVKDNGKCPLTSIPIDQNSIQILYD